MDPLSLTASIIAIIQLSSEVIGFIGAATGATRERRRLREEVLACDKILQELKDEADDSEEGAAWSKTINALEGPDAPLGRLLLALRLVKAKLEPRDGGKLRTSLRWPFEGKDVEKIIGAIEREKALLNLALNNDHRKLTQDLKRVAKENTRQLLELTSAVKETSEESKEQFVELRKDLANIEKVQSHLNDGINHLNKSDDHQKEEEKKEDILNWLITIDYSSQQSDFINRRTPGTGQWLLESAEFKEWVVTDQKTLFCPGIPGAGKTILTSIVVEELYERFRSRNAEDGTGIGIAYFYCNFRRRNEQTTYGILASLLKQLCQETASLPEVVEELYKHHHDRGTRPSITAVSTTLQVVVQKFSRVFIILDALDECQTSDGCRTSVLTEILKLKANIFATSRPVPEVTERFSQSIRLEIRAKDDDVGMYLDDHMYRLPGFVATNPSLQEDIKSTITRLVQGMFLLAQLYIDSLVGKSSPKAVRLAMANLPTGSTVKAYDFAYDHAMERIEGQLADQEHLAKQVLSWVVCAEEPLTAEELQHALAVELGELKLDEDNIPQLQDMISVCAGLITFDEGSRIIRLVHYTTQEYFDRTQKKWFPDAETELTIKCVTYLSYSIFDSGGCQGVWGYTHRRKLNPLFKYAALHWGNHSRKSLSTCSEIKRFLECSCKVDASCQVLQIASQDSGKFVTAPSRMTRLHLAAYFGLQELAEECLIEESGFDAVDSVHMTPLSWAARNDHKTVVQRLLVEYGVHQESLGAAHYLVLLTWVMQRCLPPIFWAVETGNEKLMKALLARDGVNPDAQDLTPAHMTPLTMAVKRGDHNIVKLLLATGKVDVNKADSRRMTSLAWAAVKGFDDIIKSLLETGKVNIDKKDYRARTTLSMVLENTARQELKLANSTGRFLPVAVVDATCFDTIKLLLQYGADPNEDRPFDFNFKDRGVKAPFTMYHKTELAAILESEAATIIIEHELKLSRHDGWGERALKWAFLHGLMSTVILFLAKGVLPNINDGYAQSLLRWAITRSEMVIAENLVRNGVDINAEDRAGWSLLWRSLQSGDVAAVKWLLDHKADPNADGCCRVMVRWAAGEGFEEIVRLLLTSGGLETTLAKECAEVGLVAAAKQGQAAVVKLLLDMGVDANSVDEKGKTALYYATLYNRDAVVKFLRDHTS